MSALVGAAVGPYEIIEKRGQGGMATVYKAYHPALDRYVALKILHPVFKEESSFAERFQREAQVVARLEHPNIIPIFDHAEHEGQPYLVFRYVDGVTLKERVQEGPLSADQVFHVMSEVAAGLDYAHSQGVLHRDIKPSNIMLTDDGRVFIADFGLARIAQTGESTLSQNMIMGTPHYISPEQARGDITLDGRTDLYSLAIILFELIAGQVPFDAETSYTIIHDHIFTPPPKPSDINRDISPELEALLLKALAKNKEDRYPDGAALVRALASALGLDAADLSAHSSQLSTTLAGKAESTRFVTAAFPAKNGHGPANPSSAEAVLPKSTRTARWLRRRSRYVVAAGAVLGMMVIASLVLGSLSAGAAEQPNRPATAEIVQVENQEPALLPSRVLPQETIASTKSGSAVNLIDTGSLVALFQGGRSSEAEYYFARLLEEQRSPLAGRALAEQFIASGDFDNAISVLTITLERFPDEYYLLHLHMMSLILAQGPPDEAAALVARIDSAPLNEVTADLGRAYLSNSYNLPLAALKILSSTLATAQNPYQAEVYFLTGRIYQEQSEFTLALDAYDEALDAPPPSWLKPHIQFQLASLPVLQDDDTGTMASGDLGGGDTTGGGTTGGTTGGGTTGGGTTGGGNTGGGTTGGGNTGGGTTGGGNTGNGNGGGNNGNGGGNNGNGGGNNGNGGGNNGNGTGTNGNGVGARK